MLRELLRELGRAEFPMAIREGITESFPPELDSLLPEEAALMGRAVDKRRREFVAGRTLAKAAMRGLGAPDAAALPLVNGEDRAPRWPDGLVGSITHTRGWAAAAVARSEHLTAVGLDVEDGSPLKDKLWRQICSPEDHAHLASFDEPLRGVLAKVVFSAKEAAYKAQYTLTQQYLGFMAMQIELVPEPDAAGRTGGFVAHFRQPSGERFAIGDTLRGRFVVTAEHVATAVVLP